MRSAPLRHAIGFFGMLIVAGSVALARPGAASGSDPSSARAFADDERVALRYAAYFGPLRLLSVVTASSVSTSQYAMDVTVETVGVVRVLFPWTEVSSSHGLVQDSGLHPLGHRAVSRFRGASSRIELSYQPDGQIELSAEIPSSEPPRAEVPPELRRDTVDPLTATIALIRNNAAGEPCTGTWHIYDGRVRYDLRFVDQGASTVDPAHGARYHGAAHLCEATVEPIAGFLDSEVWDKKEETKLRYWLAPVLDGVRPIPVLLEFAASAGAVRIYLTDAQAGDGAPAPSGS